MQPLLHVCTVLFRTHATHCCTTYCCTSYCCISYCCTSYCCISYCCTSNCYNCANCSNCSNYYILLNYLLLNIILLHYTFSHYILLYYILLHYKILFTNGKFGASLTQMCPVINTTSSGALHLLQPALHVCTVLFRTHAHTSSSSCVKLSQGNL